MKTCLIYSFTFHLTAGAGLGFNNITGNVCPDTTTSELDVSSPPSTEPQPPAARENGLSIFTGVHHTNAMVAGTVGGVVSSAQTLLRSMEKPTSSGELSPGSDIQVLTTMSPDVIRHLVVDNDSESTSPLTSPGVTSPIESSSLYSPDGTLHDMNTQLSMVERAEGLHLDDPLTTMDSSTFWRIVSDDDEDTTRTRKALRAPGRSDAVTSMTKETPVGDAADPQQKVFDASGAVSHSQYVFTKFGSDVPIFTFGAHAKPETLTNNVIASRYVAHCHIIYIIKLCSNRALYFSLC